jgi:hypothetical protein
MLKSALTIEDVLEIEKIESSLTNSEKFILKPEPNQVLSRALSRLLSFIDISKKYEKLAYLRAMAEKFVDYLNVQIPNLKPIESTNRSHL